MRGERANTCSRIRHWLETGDRSAVADVVAQVLRILTDVCANVEHTVELELLEQPLEQMLAVDKPGFFFSDKAKVADLRHAIDVA